MSSDRKHRNRQAFDTDQIGLGLSYDDYAVMGLVSVAFSQLDLAWSFLVWSLIAQCDVITSHCADPAGQGQGVGAAITAPLSFRRKVDLAVALSIARFGEKDPRLPTVQAAAKRCAPIEEQRNTMIHSWWSPRGTPETGVDISRTSRTKHGLDRRKGLTISSDDGIDSVGLAQLAVTMLDLVQELHRLRLAMYPRVDH